MPFVKFHQPCFECGSSDAASINEDGSAWCFSCSKYFKNYSTQEVQQPDTITEFDTYQRNKNMSDNNPSAQFNELIDRKISLATAKKYGVKSTLSNN